MTVADFEMTQDSLWMAGMPGSQPRGPHLTRRDDVTNIPLNAALYYWSYKRKASNTQRTRLHKNAHQKTVITSLFDIR